MDFRKQQNEILKIMDMAVEIVMSEGITAEELVNVEAYNKRLRKAIETLLKNDF